MSKLVVLGDPHLSAETAWQKETGKRIIRWLHNQDFNHPDNSLIILGDLVDKYATSPPSNDLITEFLMTCRFSKVHLLVGNHDISKMEEDDYQYVSYRFASRIDPNKFIIHEYPDVFNCQGLDIASLPFYTAPTHSLVDLELSSNPMERWDIDWTYEWDLVIVHHFLTQTMDNSPIPRELTVDAHSLLPKAQKIMAGHIHVADSSPDEYLGSLYPKKIDEMGQRFYWIHDEDGWHKHHTPRFCELYSIKYGEKLPYEVTEDRLPVYTITQSPSEDKVRDYYGDKAYIRKIITSWDNIRQGQGFGDMSPEHYSIDQEKGMISKNELMDMFEKVLLEEEQEWKKFEVTRDILEDAIDLIKQTPTNNKEEEHAAAN